METIKANEKPTSSDFSYVYAEKGDAKKSFVRVPKSTFLENFSGNVNVSTFDLTEMGLPAVPLDGTEVSVNIDTTEIRESLENGLVRLRLKLEIFGNSTTDVEGISTGTYLSFYDSYSCRLLTNKNENYEIRIIISTVGITADLILLDNSGTTEIDEDELREMLEEVLV